MDEAPNTSRITVELFAQVRNNGRILDGTRHVLGGSSEFETVFRLNKLSSDDELRTWTVHMCIPATSSCVRACCPLSSQWTDLVEIVAAERSP